MSDFFSEFLHVSQIYSENKEEKTPQKEDPPKKEDEPNKPEKAEDAPKKENQVLISQRTRKRTEQDQIQEIIDLYYQKDSKSDEAEETDISEGPSFTRVE